MKDRDGNPLISGDIKPYADLRGADLRAANLGDATLVGAELQDADLRNANLVRSELRGADLRNSDLRYANLGRANLATADLTSADRLGANLEGANLEGSAGRQLATPTQVSAPRWSCSEYPHQPSTPLLLSWGVLATYPTPDRWVTCLRSGRQHEGDPRLKTVTANGSHSTTSTRAPTFGERICGTLTCGTRNCGKRTCGKRTCG